MPVDLGEMEDARPQKRRKTLGDMPTPTYRTQTLTQFMSEKAEEEQEDGDDALCIAESDADESLDGLASPASVVPQTRRSEANHQDGDPLVVSIESLHAHAGALQHNA